VCIHIINDRAQEAGTVAQQAVGKLDVDGGDNSGSRRESVVTATEDCGKRREAFEGAAVHARLGARPQHLGCALTRR
jgi:hypothetical protein